MTWTWIGLHELDMSLLINSIKGHKWTRTDIHSDTYTITHSVVGPLGLYSINSSHSLSLSLSLPIYLSLLKGIGYCTFLTSHTKYCSWGKSKTIKGYEEVFLHMYSFNLPLLSNSNDTPCFRQGTHTGKLHVDILNEADVFPFNVIHCALRISQGFTSIKRSFPLSRSS